MISEWKISFRLCSITCCPLSSSQTLAMSPFTSRRQMCLACLWIHLQSYCLGSVYHVSIPNKRHLPSFADRSVGPSLSPCLCFSHSLGIFLLSAFYSKSNRRAFIQPNLGDSGYIWLARGSEMLYQGWRWGARQARKKIRGTYPSLKLLD